MICSFTSCEDDLERVPTNALTGEDVFNSIEGYKQSLATAYIQFSGSNNFFYRSYWGLQEVTTDEVVNTWGDHQLTTLSWSAEHSQSAQVYQTGLYLITLCNNFVIESEAGTVAERGLSEAEQKEVEIFRSEVRFIRAYSYWMLMDLFANPTNGLLNIKSKTPIHKIDVYNMLGAKIKSYSKLSVLDISALSDGLYIIKFTNNSGSKSYKRILKK